MPLKHWALAPLCVCAPVSLHVPLWLRRHFQAGLRLDPEQAEHRKEFKKLKSLDKKTKEVQPISYYCASYRYSSKNCSARNL